MQTVPVQGDHASYRLRSHEMDDSEDDAVEGSELLSGRASARRHIRRVGAWLPAAHESGPNHDHTSAGQSGRRRWVATQAVGLLLRTTIVALTMELSVQWALMLVQGKGLWWPVFARIGVAALAVTSQIPTPRRFKRRRLMAVIQGIAFVLAALVAGVVTAGLRLRETLGFLPWHPVYTQVSAGGEQTVVHVPFTQAWGRFATTIASGFEQLYAQVPPLNMGAASDAAVIIAVVGVMLVVRLLAGIPAAIPWMGILPSCRGCGGECVDAAGSAVGGGAATGGIARLGVVVDPSARRIPGHAVCRIGDDDGLGDVLHVGGACVRAVRPAHLRRGQRHVQFHDHQSDNRPQTLLDGGLLGDRLDLPVQQGAIPAYGHA